MVNHASCLWRMRVFVGLLAIAISWMAMGQDGVVSGGSPGSPGETDAGGFVPRPVSLRQLALQSSPPRRDDVDRLFEEATRDDEALFRGFQELLNTCGKLAMSHPRTEGGRQWRFGHFMSQSPAHYLAHRIAARLEGACPSEEKAELQEAFLEYVASVLPGLVPKMKLDDRAHLMCRTVFDDRLYTPSFPLDPLLDRILVLAESATDCGQQRSVLGSICRIAPRHPDSLEYILQRVADTTSEQDAERIRRSLMNQRSLVLGPVPTEAEYISFTQLPTAELARGAIAEFGTSHAKCYLDIIEQSRLEDPELYTVLADSMDEYGGHVFLAFWVVGGVVRPPVLDTASEERKQFVTAIVDWSAERVAEAKKGTDAPALLYHAMGEMLARGIEDDQTREITMPDFHEVHESERILDILFSCLKSESTGFQSSSTDGLLRIAKERGELRQIIYEKGKEAFARGSESLDGLDAPSYYKWKDFIRKYEKSRGEEGVE